MCGAQRTDHLLESALSVHHVGPRNQTQVTELGNLMSQLTLHEPPSPQCQAPGSQPKLVLGFSPNNSKKKTLFPRMI